MEILDNVNKTLGEDLKKTIRKGGKISVIAACFSIYAYKELKKELEKIDELRFIFTSPTFTADKFSKTQREFYIPKLERERSLYGTEFEIKLRNELTQKSIAKECADWIKRKVVFKSNITKENMFGFMTVDNTSYTPLQGFSTVDLGCERGNNAYYPIQKIDSSEMSSYYINLFSSLWHDDKKFQDVTDEVIESISTAYKENSPEFIYFFTLYNIFNEFLKDISEDDLPNEAIGFKKSKIWNMLYDFQKDAVIAVISKLEKFNGCILADSVGLGKTFTALAIIKYYENRNKSVLVLCPKKLSANWMMYRGNYKNNPIMEDRLRYDVLYHTDLSRDSGYSNGTNLSLLNWNNFDLVVIDESHNFRNGGELSGDNSKENRYLRLMNKVIKTGVKTKVLMLSATPVNNRFVDLKHQLELAYEGQAHIINEKLNLKKGINEIFRNAQTAFNYWNKLDASSRTTESLMKNLDFEFFELLDSVTIARSRKHIEKYYDMSGLGKFPRRLPPKSLRPSLTDLKNGIDYNSIYNMLTDLNLEVYAPFSYIHESMIDKYTDLVHHKGTSLTQKGREEGIRRLMRVNLLKRLESSVYSFKLTLRRIYKLIQDTVAEINQYKDCVYTYPPKRSKKHYTLDSSKSAYLIYANYDLDLDSDDENKEVFVGGKIKIDLADMDYASWQRELEYDSVILQNLLSMVDNITPEHDCKLQALFELVDHKINNPINDGNKKILIFTAFSDTADYLYENISTFAKEKYNLNSALISGDVDGKSTIKGLKADFNTVLTYFSPVSKSRHLLEESSNHDIDILIATDCISEGQNLQDCDYVVNYDIHWNPVRIIQRFGRVDRIGSKNECIRLVNFWPDMDLDEYIQLKTRVENRMKLAVMTSTGDDDLINADEKGDLEYRSSQLKRLQSEVVDLEDMSDGISITDLGLNEFRLDLIEYMKHDGNIDKAPCGMHAVVASEDTGQRGVIFILRNINNSVNSNNRNAIHPFYMVYMGDDGEVVTDYLNPKRILDTLRYLCKGKKEPIKELYRKFNLETDDGRKMDNVSYLLNKSIESIISVKNESDIDSLFSPGGTTALLSDIKGLEDFELISFLVVM